MESLGLAFSAAGALTQVLECFEYVYVARNFGNDYQIYQLKLDNARLRLSRWGSSVDLKSAPKQEQDQAIRALQKIYDLFTKTEELSDEFAKKNHKQKYYAGSQEPPESNRLDKITEALHEKMRDLSLLRERQPSKSTLKKSKWAIYSKEHMASLTENLTTLTTELVELFPNAREEQKKLCEIEMLGFLDNIRVLREAIGEQDGILAEELKRILEPRERSIKFQNNLKDNAKIGAMMDTNAGKIDQKF
ncbi:hypothetical protein J7T55_007160 [Diaporthe amygdali]|uniref:uncharacterized protein n=1 Tax=Phomopsis amygdali TaxID=1214568 RepID=UPI0022FE3D22|nr:uncharacterized protein J7T55_007160 [Diaporthe amygdali]KAJ0108042.1 hypothetical protein J7T55_007160 [Diaporthe amygdali]